MSLYIARLSIIACLFIHATGCFNIDKPHSSERLQPSGFTIKGISLVAPVNRIDDTKMKPIVNVNANSIALMPYAFFSPENPEVRYNQHGQHWGENIEGIIKSIQLAHQQNMSVMLKPHLWMGRGGYTGTFTLSGEREWQIWEDSYKKYILHFAHVADSMKVELFCIGTELGASIKARPQYWNKLIDTLKQIYNGKLTYAGNWDDYKLFPFWDKLDYIGVDAYFPISTEKTPSVNSIQKGWEIHTSELEKISKKNNLPILFTEYGYRNVDYAGKEPWTENDGDQNNDAQSNTLEGLYKSFAGKKWFAGGYLWKWYVGNYRHRNDKIDFTPQNKPAEKVIEKWYRD